MRRFTGLTLAVALSACATPQADKPASLQNTLYVVGDHAAPVQATAIPDSKDAKPEAVSDSTLRPLLWPLSGR
jgi:hypothetical protein